MRARVRHSLGRRLPRPIRDLGRRLLDHMDQHRELVQRQAAKRELHRQTHLRHDAIIRERRGRTPVRVVFIVLNASVWKVDPVFRRMQLDERFMPMILVAPHMTRGEAYREEQATACVRQFTARGYPVHCASVSADHKEGTSVGALEPDLVFFTNPHPLTTHDCYEGAFSRYLSCYVPYDHQIAKYGGDQANYNQDFHNAMWRIFAPHRVSMRTARRVGAARGANVRVTGYPVSETLSSGAQETGAWKATPLPVPRLIWAPHHTITSEDLPFGTFLRYAKHFRHLVESTQGSIQWALKPHPMLKDNLFHHPDWGVERTEEYFAFWRDSPNSQLTEHGYEDLFRDSSALIHDSGSFLAEYAYLDRPALFLPRFDSPQTYLNAFGMAAYRACQVGSAAADIDAFVDSVAAGDDPLVRPRRRFRHRYLGVTAALTPSDRIMRGICDALGV